MDRFTFPKDSRKLIKAALRAGFEFTMNKGHGKLYTPDGRFIVVGSSVSDTNGSKILNRQIRDAARRCGIELET